MDEQKPRPETVPVEPRKATTDNKQTPDRHQLKAELFATIRRLRLLGGL